MINVYWSFLEKEWMRAKEPSSVYANTFSKYSLKNKFNTPTQCPAIYEEMNNLFALHSVYDYTIYFNNDTAYSKEYDQDFFNRHVMIRDINLKMISFSQPFIFFSDEDSLRMTVQIPPYIDNPNIINQCIFVPGVIDIGKWFRNIDFAFYLRDGHESFSISSEEIFSYIKFNTNQKISFKKFRPTDKIISISNSCSNANKNLKYKRKTLEDSYKLFSKSMKKELIKEIKNNLEKM